MFNFAILSKLKGCWKTKSHAAGEEVNKKETYYMIRCRKSFTCNSCDYDHKWAFPI